MNGVLRRQDVKTSSSRLCKSKRENPETARTWDESIRILKKGDHYILVLWGVLRPRYDNLKLIATASLVLALLLGTELSLLQTTTTFIGTRTATSRINTDGG